MRRTTSSMSGSSTEKSTIAACSATAAASAAALASSRRKASHWRRAAMRTTRAPGPLRGRARPLGAPPQVPPPAVAVAQRLGVAVVDHLAVVDDHDAPAQALDV